MRIDLFLQGYVICEAQGTEETALFELFRKERFSPKRTKRCPKTQKIRFIMTARSAKRLFAACEAQGIALSVVKSGGVPTLFCRFRTRPGLIVGVVLGLMMLACSGLFVWEIKLTGNVTISQEELREELALSGLRRGSFLPTLDEQEVALALRQGDGRIVYAGVNVVGTVAYVQVREQESGGAELPRSPANLVAKCDGVITMPLVFEGECLVREGEVVRAGQLLASGVLDTQNHGYRVTRAAGQILARTTHTYTVRVPFAREESYYTGKRSYALSLFFFDFERKIFKSTGNDIGNYDIIEKIKWFTLPDGKRLPFGIGVTTVAQKKSRLVTYTAMQTRAEAYAELERLLAQDSEGRTLLQRTVECRVDGEGITLVCTVICEEDIAKTLEFALQP